MTSAGRSFQLLEFLATVPTASHGELAAALGFPKSTLSDLLGEMRSMQLVELQAGRFSLGPRVFSLAHRVRQVTNIPVMRDVLAVIAEATGETTHFSVETGGNETVAGAMLPIDCVESSKNMRIAVGIGHPRPMWGTAAGRVLLAATGRRSAALPHDVASAWTPGADSDEDVDTAAVIDAQLDEIAAVGHCLFYAEERQVVTVAVPVYSESTWPLGAVSVSGPAFRLNAPLAQLLRPIADELARRSLSLPSTHAGSPVAG